MTSFEIDCFGISNIGLVRNNNEDVWMFLPEKNFFILADGMGGHNAGEVAASMTAESLYNSMLTLPKNATVQEACRFLRQSISQANAKVYYESHNLPGCSGMGTTLSCFLIKNDFLIYAHVGDSRLYRLRKQLDQLTEDHSLRQAAVAAKRNDATLALIHRNVITRAIGTHLNIQPDIGIIPLHSNDLYMLCSDGLSDYVESKTLFQLLSASIPLEEIGKNLIQAALKKGGNDNITLLLTKIL